MSQLLIKAMIVKLLFINFKFMALQIPFWDSNITIPINKIFCQSKCLNMSFQFRDVSVQQRLIYKSVLLQVLIIIAMWFRINHPNTSRGCRKKLLREVERMGHYVPLYSENHIIMIINLPSMNLNYFKTFLTEKVLIWQKKY